MKDGATYTISKENVSDEYVKAAKNGRIDLMLEIDESEFARYISKAVRAWAIQNILAQAPTPILHYYLYGDVPEVDDKMREVFFDYAKNRKLIMPQLPADTADPKEELTRNLFEVRF